MPEMSQKLTEKLAKDPCLAHSLQAMAVHMCNTRPQAPALPDPPCSTSWALAGYATNSSNHRAIAVIDGQ
jgi:hypothetical protein